ncbi:polysaccharide biosynthesis C-terminal domain-containing protein [Leucothrix arctica]|uniref:Polysaccharide biosynthesis protein n=1 Tax=Leucothrix arctica TaxID=1481894 RepID=A0A317CKP6_9GAMM|nr:polysaccharide biosynthesis C-terminal domain-containing protein [Leucothrix arctica]PWQ98909.1 polysaccharide biosynthesis protein [Leucothrix arctica]
MKIINKLRHNPLIIQSALSIIARFTGVALNFAVAILISRQLSLGNAGVIFLLMTFVSGVALMSRFGLDQLIVKEVASAPEDQHGFKTSYLKNTHELVFALSLVFVGIWVLLSPYAQQAFFDGAIDLHHLMWASLCVVFFNFITVNSFYLKGIRQSSLSVLTQNALPAITFLILIAVAWQYFVSGTGHIVLYIVSLVAAGALSFLFVKSHLSSKENNGDIAPKFHKLFIKSLPLAPISFFSFMMLWADTVMVGYFLSNEKVALYSVAAKISYISLFFLGALDATIYPRLLAIYNHKPEKLWSFFWQATGLVIAVLVAVTGIMYLLSDYLLLAFRPEYVAASSALGLLLLAQLLRAASLTFSFMFIAREKVRFLNISLTIAMVVNLVANIFMIPRYGIEGAAIATLLANATLVAFVIIMFYQQKLLSRPKQSEAASYDS